MKYLKGVCLVVFLAAGCDGGGRLIDDHNPHYLRGIRLRQARQYADSAEAFAKCLRNSPGSASAHLQLAMLYEDHLNSSIDAIYHYRQYLVKRPQGEYAELAAESLLRVQNKMLSVLLENAPELNATEADSLVDQSAIEELQRIKAQKLFLLERLQEMNRENRALREAVARLSRQPESMRNDVPVAAAAGATATGLPGTPAGQVGTASAERLYVVVKGDTLSSVSRETYGSSTFWPALRNYNRDILGDEDILLPGMKLRIPEKSVLEQSR